MIINNSNRTELLTDKKFDALYPDIHRQHSNIHWTPIEVAKAALEWLEITPETKVLDIGSGVGKFCSLGALMTTGQFTGVEKRRELIETAQEIGKKLNLKNVRYIHANVTNINLSEFDSFYYYNPFCEQIATSDLIDKTISFSPDKYRWYEDYVINQLRHLPLKTKVVTYYSKYFAFPDNYELKDLKFNGTLALWVKIKN